MKLRGFAILLIVLLCSFTVYAELFDDLRNYWSADTVNLTATLLIDSHGPRNGTLSGNTTFNTTIKKIGDAGLSFKSGPYVNVSSFALTSQGSIGCWVNTSRNCASTNCDYQIIHATTPTTGIDIQYTYSAGAGGQILYAGVNGGNFINTVSKLSPNVWHEFIYTWNGTHLALYVDGMLNASSANTATPGTGSRDILFGATALNQFNLHGHLDECKYWNRSLTAAEVSELYNGGSGLSYSDIALTMPNITALNCTSCNGGAGDNESPYLGVDTTPTFNLTTSARAWCRISDEDHNYTDMGDTRNCTTTGSTSHVCTLTSQDSLTQSIDYVYISCKSSTGAQGATSTSGPLQMIRDESDAIDVGIQASAVWPGATVYDDQQVYLRDLNNNQVLGTIDRVVVYGNQRWLLHYTNTTTLGLFNITPVVYSLEMVNVSIGSIPDQVRAFINSTKT